MLKHLVFLKFRDNISESDIEKLESMLDRLPSVIPEIKGYLFGRDVVKSERSYDFALDSDFEDLDALKRYQQHPEHLKVLEHVKSICESILAVDFYYEG
ncbi:Dabb family protein [Thermodesulforhabdus norvegica]|uniref:Stress responsive A/B Barrel Domain n=1 Tax=Thermodesulforhabdus norvegica TaxID=39841 RepID=A0A1I4QRS1_9BACT|nr:Dabb family protein [Thermodesulforhabdus norvegica]SFM42739.1 Stress responsive A/B Barrel Domain [Thermodesulforhabdus norvegica]